MVSPAVPEGREADRRWKILDRKRRSALLRGVHPVDREEATTALGYARRMRGRSQLVASLAAAGAFVVYIAIALLVGGETSTEDWILAGGVAVGAGVAFEVVGRYRARRLERSAAEALKD